MKRTKGFGLSLLVLLISLVGLVACGGEAPPTPTLPPPTNTPVPPTPTTAPTATARSSGGTSAGTSASSGDVAKLQDAIRETSGLKSYHYTMNVDATEASQTANVEGDYVAPDKGYVKGTVAGQSIEQLISGGTVFVKDSSGKWVERQEETKTGNGLQLVDPTTFASDANPINGLDSILEASKDWRDLGEDKVNGVKVHHYAFSLDSAKMLGSSSADMAQQMGGALPSLGGGEMWVDLNTKYVHKMAVNLDFGMLMRLVAEAMASAFGGTPTPGGPTPTALPAANFQINMIVSKHNDPSITVPEAPAVTPKTSTSTTSTPDAIATIGNIGLGSGGPITSEVLNIGQTGDADGFKVTLSSVRRTEKGALGNADAGKEYVIVKLTIENTTDTEKPISSLLQFSIKDDAGKEYNVDLFSDVAKTPDGTVPAKGKLEGESGFQVPRDAKGLTFVFAPLLAEGKLQFKLDK